MIRVYHITNTATGQYFYLERDFLSYQQRLMAYCMNLNKSTKCPNTYTFGSIEMTEAQYENERQKAYQFEQERVRAKENQPQRNYRIIAPKFEQ